MPSSVFASGDDSIEVRDEILNDIMNDPMVKRILKYVSQDENGYVTFDIKAAKKDGQSSEVITQGNLFNEISKGYSDLGNDNYGMMAHPTGIPIWGNWCGPGYGGGLQKIYWMQLVRSMI